MIIVNKLLDYTAKWNLPRIYLFTGNPVTNRYGGIVMGRGAARMCRDKFYDVDKEFGKGIKNNPSANIMFTKVGDKKWLGWFKVKDHWKSHANLALIAESTKQLAAIASQHPQYTFHMNYPGIGNGKLVFEEVNPILQQLPDNVYLYITGRY